MVGTIDPAIRFGYADVGWGQLHYATAGPDDGPPLLCLHQTPRSWDEFRELMVALAPTRRTLALDTPGMGASSPHPDGPSIEAYADAAALFLDALGVDEVDVVGHHTGGVIAVELAASHPDRVRRLVLTSTAYVDEASRERRKSRPPIDEVERQADGAHLVELWSRRRPLYPADRPDVLERYVRDALAAVDAEEGHLAVGAYRMEERVGLVGAPSLVIGASADPYAFGELEPLAARLAHAQTAVIEGGMVGLVENEADTLAALINRFLDPEQPLPRDDAGV